MLFSSLSFLSVFLPLTIVIYFLTPTIRLRNMVLLFSSFVFYVWGEAEWTSIFVVSIILNYVFGRLIQRTPDRHRARIVLGICIAVNLALLGYFKYFGFFLEQLNSILGFAGYSAIMATTPHLPLGISFYTFHGLTYNVDIYYGRARAQGLFNVALYKAFFPQLVAGPIVRYHTVAEALRERHVTIDAFGSGVERFCIGLGKKVLIANTVAVPADMIFAMPASDLTTPLAWFGLICYAIQIYFDFSGYSDMAIGMAKMFGFPFPENFNHPYTARSIRDFWRRWHISMTIFFRDYVYIPLGGNRNGPVQTYRNLVLVFLLTGFWHGASWNFVVWGGFHGFFLIIERSAIGRVLAALPLALQHVYTLLVVLVAWVFFRASDLTHAGGYLSAMFGFGTEAVRSAQIVQYHLTPVVYVAILAGIAFSGPWISNGLNAFGRRCASMPSLDNIASDIPYMRTLALLALLCLSWLSVAAGAYNPFIYFRF